eukprot:TRINITY_DN14137_c0_g1_i3.p1 TRINITY_DN14137_c0_g1~~TRINITY_DN14137_c0_g1_i3.p1  ORF type:complete len:320 (+),score=51.45 TRINITY_DN14137_c0_g1_i3:60-962(+)
MCIRDRCYKEKEGQPVLTEATADLQQRVLKLDEEINEMQRSKKGDGLSFEEFRQRFQSILESVGDLQESGAKKLQNYFDSFVHYFALVSTSIFPPKSNQIQRSDLSTNQGIDTLLLLTAFAKQSKSLPVNQRESRLYDGSNLEEDIQYLRKIIDDRTSYVQIVGLTVIKLVLSKENQTKIFFPTAQEITAIDDDIELGKKLFSQVTNSVEVPSLDGFIESDEHKLAINDAITIICGLINNEEYEKEKLDVELLCRILLERRIESPKAQQIQDIQITLQDAESHYSGRVRGQGCSNKCLLM